MNDKLISMHAVISLLEKRWRGTDRVNRRLESRFAGGLSDLVQEIMELPERGMQDEEHEDAETGKSSFPRLPG